MSVDTYLKRKNLSRYRTTRCWQPAKVGQLRTREIICYEEALVSSLRVLL